MAQVIDESLSLPHIVLTEGHSILYVQLALARLDQIVSDEEQIDSGFPPCDPVCEVRPRLNLLIDSFRNGWLGSFYCHKLLAGVGSICPACYHHLGENAREEFSYLLSILEAFYTMTHRMYAAGELGALSVDEMSYQLATRLKGKVFQPVVLEMLEAQATTECFLGPDTLKQFEYKFVNAIEQYIQAHEELNQVPKGGPFDDYHSNMASMIRFPLYDHVYMELVDFSADLALSQTQKERSDFAETFLEKIAGFFTHVSPLLIPHVSEDDGLEDDEAQDEDGWEAIELDNLTDVLSGPDTASIDEVSQVICHPEDQTCSICWETVVSLRKLNACTHVFCEDCLTSQLDSQHASRYRCAVCRQELFD